MRGCLRPLIQIVATFQMDHRLLRNFHNHLKNNSKSNPNALHETKNTDRPQQNIRQRFFFLIFSCLFFFPKTRMRKIDIIFSSVTHKTNGLYLQTATANALSRPNVCHSKS